MEIKYLSSSVVETHLLAEKIASILKNGAIITLDGDLGAGKTCFTQGLAKAIGIKRVVTSPTFNIMKIYEGDYTLYHLDLYRLSEVGFDMDLEEYIYGDGISVVEWSHNVDSLFDSHALRIDIKVIDDTKREFIISSNNEIYKELEGLL